MKLELIRKEFTEVSTIGDLMIDGEFLCYTLEDVVREVKIPGQTAIPYGSYNVITNYSNRFKRLMPLLENVPSFSGVRIHAGNTDKNTDGCLLLGYTKKQDFIGRSQKAFNDFFYKLQVGLEIGKVRLEVLDDNRHRAAQSSS